MQEVSGVYTSPFLHRDERKMALRARKVSGAFEKRAPDERFPVTLRFLATGDSLQTLSFSYRLSHTTVCRIIPELKCAMHCGVHIKQPSQVSREKN